MKEKFIIQDFQALTFFGFFVMYLPVHLEFIWSHFEIISKILFWTYLKDKLLDIFLTF